MDKDIQEMLYKFKNSIMFLAEINNIDRNFLDMEDLKRIESAAYQLQIAITGFNLELYENNTDMQQFIFETWQEEAQIAETVSMQILRTFMEENL